MAYVRKTVDEYLLLYDYGNGLDVISRCSTAAEAKRDFKSYVENEGIYPTIKKQRIRKTFNAVAKKITT